MRSNSTPVPGALDLVAGKSLTHAQAVALIASRICRPKEGERAARDRARKRLDSHIRSKKLKADANRRIAVIEFGRWAAELWPKEFDDLPRLPRSLVLRAQTGQYNMTGRDVRIHIRSAKPDDVLKCHAIIDALNAKNWQLDARNSQLETELRGLKIKIGTLELELKLCLEKKLNRKARATAAGKQGGRGNTK